MPRILIVDDDDNVRKMLRFRLQDSYEILDTASPEEALAITLQQRPDVILLDLMMPNYSGFEMCQTLGSLSFTQRIPVFIVSGQSAGRYKDFCEKLGAKDYFQKPVDFDALKARLAAVFREKRVERRSEPRVRLRALLKLRGTEGKGRPFEELTVTDNVSLSGFLAGCTAQLPTDAVVEIFLVEGGGGEQLVGKARAVRVEWPGTPGQRYGFRFVEKTGPWLLK